MKLIKKWIKKLDEKMRKKSSKSCGCCDDSCKPAKKKTKAVKKK